MSEMYNILLENEFIDGFKTQCDLYEISHKL